MIALHPHPRQGGTTLIEVLVTMVILAFGLLGIAAFQSKAQVGAVESYQRAQAVVLLEDMVARINGNRAAAATYVSATPFGTGNSTVPDDCSGVAAGMALDVCEWNSRLKGAAEVQENEAKVGAMVGARGCIELIQAEDATPGTCKPGIYQVSVAWQGMHETRAPSLACGEGEYGDNDNLRRAIAVRVAVGLPTCQ